MALIHILDKQNDAIIGTLDNERGEYYRAELVKNIDNTNFFDFIARAELDKLEKRNRVLVQDMDGVFNEFIINFSEKYTRGEALIKTDASFTDLRKAKIFKPESWGGQTAETALTTTLNGTEWSPGTVEFTVSRNFVIDDYRDAYSMLSLIASNFGLEIKFRVEVSGNKIVGRYVDLVVDRASFEGKEITLGKDLVGITRVENSIDIVTSLVGIGPEREDGTRYVVTVEDDEALQRWGRHGKHLIGKYEPETSDENMTVERLTQLTQAELKKRIDSSVAYECEAVALEHLFGRQHEKIREGQVVRIKDDGYSPPLYLEAQIQEMRIDPATMRVTNFKIGNFIEYKRDELEALKAIKDTLRTKASRSYAEQVANQAEDNVRTDIEQGNVALPAESIAGMIDAGKVDVSLTIDSTIPFAADSNVFYGNGPYFLTDVLEDRNYHRAVVLSFVHDKRYVFIRVYGNWTSIDPGSDPVLDGSCQFIMSTSKDPADAIPGGSGQFTEKAPTEGARTLVLDMGEPTKQIKDIHVLFRASGSKTSTAFPGANLRLGYKGQND